jgi:hypothetical protein
MPRVHLQASAIGVWTHPVALHTRVHDLMDFWPMRSFAIVYTRHMMMNLAAHEQLLTSLMSASKARLKLRSNGHSIKDWQGMLSL